MSAGSKGVSPAFPTIMTAPASDGAIPVVSKLRSPEPAPGSGDATPPGAAGSIGTPVIVARVVEVVLVVVAATVVVVVAGTVVVGVVGTVVVVAAGTVVVGVVGTVVGVVGTVVGVVGTVVGVVGTVVGVVGTVVGVVGTVVGVVGVHGSYPFPLPGPPRGLSQAGGIPPGGSARAATGTTASTAAINSTTPAPRRFPMAPYRHLRTIISSADREHPK